MTIKEKIEVMKACVEGNKIQMRDVNKSTWYDVEQPSWNWDACEYRVKPEPVLPKSWEEFCKTHPMTNTEVYIDIDSEINSVEEGNDRLSDRDANLLPNRQIAEAMLALCKLIQLRDCYNEGWQPDWSNDSVEKYPVYYYEGDSANRRSFNVLTFKTAILRKQFLENFWELIKIAKPLL